MIENGLPKPPYLPEGRGLDYISRDYSRLARLAWGVATTSRCLKHQTGAVIARGDVIVGAGSNDIENPPPGGCPRIALPTGTGYELCARCKQKGHAEISAIENADERAKANGLPLDLHGCDLYLAGHWWVCKDCWKAIIREGINRVFIVL